MILTGLEGYLSAVWANAFPASIHSTQATKIPRRFISRSSPSHFPQQSLPPRAFAGAPPRGRQKNGSGGGPAMPGRARAREQSVVLHASDTFLPALSRLRLGELPMIRPLAALAVCGVVLIAVGLAGCTDNAPPSGQPTFYLDLAEPDAVLDAAAAQSMISGYRSNNGLGPVTLDPQLMQLAADAGAGHGGEGQARPRRRCAVSRAHPQIGFRCRGRGREYRRRLSHARRGIFRLARFAAAPRQHAQRQRHPHGHRRGLYAANRNTRCSGR